MESGDSVHYRKLAGRSECLKSASRDNSRMVGKPEVMVRSGLLELLPHSPLERSRWRDGRFACYAPRVMPQGRAFNCDFRFSLIFLSQAKSIGCKQKKIQFP